MHLSGSDDWSIKSFEEIVTRPIGELNEMVKCYIDDPPTNSLVPFDKIYDKTQEIIERIRVFKFSSLNRRRDQLDSLFQLPDTDTEFPKLRVPLTSTPNSLSFSHKEGNNLFFLGKHL